MSQYDDIVPMELDAFLHQFPSLGVDDYLRQKRAEGRGRATARTPGSARRRKTPQTPAMRGRSRSRGNAARKVSFPSITKSRSGSRGNMDIDMPQGRMDPVLSAMLSGNNKPYEKALKRIKANTRKVRHKNARTVLKKMPAGGKPYARRGRMSMKKPKGAYRGAVMPKWAKGETKHILANDHSTQAVAEAGSLSAAGSGVESTNGIPLPMDIGAIRAFSVNPVEQGNSSVQRNGRSVDGTYLRVQGHIQNQSTATNQRCYVRMLVLAVKGGRQQGDNQDRQSAGFLTSRLYKKIDGTIVGFTPPSSTAGSGATAVRTLQLPVNKGLYTVLADQKMQLSGAGEGFGASDRLFDLKIPLKQRTKFQNEYADSFESNNICFVVQTVDPACVDGTPPAGSVKLEFESKYSYKDF